MAEDMIQDDLLVWICPTGWKITDSVNCSVDPSGHEASRNKLKIYLEKNFVIFL